MLVWPQPTRLNEREIFEPWDEFQKLRKFQKLTVNSTHPTQTVYILISEIFGWIPQFEHVRISNKLSESSSCREDFTDLPIHDEHTPSRGLLALAFFERIFIGRQRHWNEGSLTAPLNQFEGRDFPRSLSKFYLIWGGRPAKKKFAYSPALFQSFTWFEGACRAPSAESRGCKRPFKHAGCRTVAACRQ